MTKKVNTGFPITDAITNDGSITLYKWAQIADVNLHIHDILETITLDKDNFDVITDYGTFIPNHFSIIMENKPTYNCPTCNKETNEPSGKCTICELIK